MVPLESSSSMYPMRAAEMFQQKQLYTLSSVIVTFSERSWKKVRLLQVIGTNLASRLSQSFESMQRLCDKYNRAIDSIHQLVSGFISAREFHVHTNMSRTAITVGCSLSLDAGSNISWRRLVQLD